MGVVSLIEECQHDCRVSKLRIACNVWGNEGVSDLETHPGYALLRTCCTNTGNHLRDVNLGTPNVKRPVGAVTP